MRPPLLLLLIVACFPKRVALPDDGDAIRAADDVCPHLPEDVDGFEDGDGCPDPDNDRDGVADVDDACPDTAEDPDGFEDADGCPDPDNDADGVADVDDLCPLARETFNGLDDADGCPDEVAAMVDADVPAMIRVFECDGPALPQPAPRPSSHLVLDLPRHATDVDAASGWLVAALRRAGYPDPVWFCLPDGVAALTTLERTDAGGAPASPRWSQDSDRPSLLDRLLSLVLDRPGTWRALVFAISHRPPAVDGPAPTATTFNDLGVRGSLAPSEAALDAPTAGMRLTVLVYELVQPDGATAATLRRPGALTAQTHLRAAGLSAVLLP